MVSFLLIVAIGRYVCYASEPTMADYEATIKYNEFKIQQCEDIKNQLAVTASLIKQQEWHDTDFVASLDAKWNAQKEYQDLLIRINKNLQSILGQLKPKQEKHVYIGNFKITHYCTENYYHRCNDGNASSTATGTVPTPGRTIAVDPKIIPYGTRVIIGEHTYIAEDTGGAIKGNRIDVCVSTHAEALRKGVNKGVPVYIVEE